MKKDIHPAYYSDAQVTCSCGNTWITGSTKKAIRTEVCSKCHPFFTGQQQRIIDIEGQVDRFYRKLQARQSFAEEKKAREDSRTSTERLIDTLTLGRRAIEALQKAGVVTVGQAIDKMVEGDQGLLDIQGFGRKSLIDMRKQLRQLGYELPVSPMTEETPEASA
jgi:large subunit ribosomal protein L31